MIKNYLYRIRAFLVSPILQVLGTQHFYVNVGTQILLFLKYKEFAHNELPLPSFDEVGFKVYSGSNEDGILLYVFALIGTTNKQFVDIGAAGVDGSNVANLIVNHGWNGLLIDANGKDLEWARSYYEGAPDIWRFPPVTINEFVTVENINAIISDNGVAGEIDLLSIDLDGVDYWIWDAIDCISPRVVVVEFQDIIGPDRSLTVPYSPDFNFRTYNEDEGSSINYNYCGASLPAFVKLAKKKGYRLVGCSRYGINAFFVRSGIEEERLPEVSVHSCFRHPRHELENPERWNKVKEMPWEEV